MVNFKDVKIMFMPDGAWGLVPRGSTVMEAVSLLGQSFNTPCGGRGVCGKCKIKLLTGDFAEAGISSGMTALSLPTPDENRFLTAEDRLSGVRLACKARLMQDAVVELLPVDNTEPEVVSYEITGVDTELKPAVKIYHLGNCRIDPAEPPQSMITLVQQELTARFGLPVLYFDTPVLGALPACLTTGDFYVLVWNDREVIGARTDAAFLGAAIDIGTTTVALYLCNLASGEILKSAAELNPQVKHGSDIITRIAYQHNDPVKLALLQANAAEAVNKLLEDTCAAMGFKPTDVADVVVVGNTIMQHFLLKMPPDSMAIAPFVPVVAEPLDIKARDLGFQVNPSAYVLCLPSLAAYVGSDVVADVLALKDHLREMESCLLLDIGTGGKIVLKSGNRMLAAACATGPALEGRTSCGSRPTSGAIGHVVIDPATLNVRVRLIGASAWHTPSGEQPVEVCGLCGSGLIDVVSQLYHAGLLEPSGKFVDDQVSPRLQGIGSQRRFVLFSATENILNQEISVTQSDVLAVLAAKGAFYGGCQLLLQKAGLARAQHVLLVGAYGAQIDTFSAYELGMFPQVEPDQVEFTGHSAGYGALLALFNEDERRMAIEVARTIECVEFSLDTSYKVAAEAGRGFNN